MSDYMEYLDMEIKDRSGFEFPSFFYRDGKWDFDDGMNLLREAGYIYNRNNADPQYGYELKSDYPEVYEFFEAYKRAHRAALIDYLVEEGYLEVLVDENLNVKKTWTPEGLRYLEESKGKLRRRAA